MTDKRQNQNLKRVLLGVLAIALVFVAVFAVTYFVTVRFVNKPAGNKPGTADELLTTDAPSDGTDDSTTDAAMLPGNEVESVSAAGGLPTGVAGGADATTVPGETTAPSAETTAGSGYTKPSSPTYINGILVVNKSYPLPDGYDPGGLTADCESAFYAMQKAAASEGLDIYIASGFRSYETQDSIYHRYVSRDGQALADTYSARPGHSEHQTGLAIDLNSISSSFAQTPEGKWVNANCWKYGFILRYPADKVDITGYMYEPWHIRYVGEAQAKAIYDSGLCLEEYLGIDSVYKY